MSIGIHCMKVLSSNLCHCSCVYFIIRSAGIRIQKRFNFLLPMFRRITTLFLLLAASGLRAQLPLSYAYVRPIVINNPNSVAIPNLQMEFDLATDALVTAGKMRADGNDIAFWDSCHELFYWIEDSSFNTTRTTFWVKVPLVPPGTHTIYLY